MSKLSLGYMLLFLAGTASLPTLAGLIFLLAAEIYIRFRAHRPERNLVLAAMILRAVRTGLLVVLHIKFFMGDIRTVQSTSMQPGLNPGDTIIIDRLTPGVLLPIIRLTGEKYIRLPAFRSLQIGDIIAFQRASGGDVLLKRIQSVSENEFFVTGDNSRSSVDSRHFGPVQKTAILGRVIFRFSR